MRDHIGWIITAASVFVAIAPWLNKLRLHLKENMYIKRVLCSKRKQILITLPTYNSSHPKIDFPYDMVVEGEVRCVEILSEFCRKIHKSAKTHFHQDSTPANIDSIHVGGPYANTAVCNLMNDYFEDTFRVWTSEKSRNVFNNHSTNSRLFRCIDVDDDCPFDGMYGGFSFGPESDHGARVDVPTNPNLGDCTVMIRIVDPETKMSTHILFGGYLFGTECVVEYFSECSKEISHKVKAANKARRKSGRAKTDNYFFVLRVNHDGTYNSRRGLEDLTDIMFAKSAQ